MSASPMNSQVQNGSNNIHLNMPALMSDGRQSDTSWVTESVVDDRLKTSTNLKSNWEYRQYLTNNATSIMNTNVRNELLYNAHQSASTGDGISPEFDQQNSNSSQNGPYLYRDLNDMTPVRPSTFSSNLKQLYLTREQQQARLSSPGIYATFNQ